MKVVALFLICAFFIGVSGALVPLYESGEIISDQYIVVLRQELNDTSVTNYFKTISNRFAVSSSDEIQKIYSLGSFNGFSARITTENLLESIRNDAEVEFIERDQIMRTVAQEEACSQQNYATWGIDRVDQVKPDLDGHYRYAATAGNNVDAYIIDTGVLITHKDFGGRAVFGANFVGDGEKNDCNGHGTHVAGTVGGTTFGIAKKATIIAVKVLGCTGSGTNSGVIEGVQYTGSQAAKSTRPSVANMSLGGGLSTALNNAVIQAIKKGVTFVSAAGNENDNACRSSPSSVAEGITVGATDIADEKGNQRDARSYFSNVGRCVHIMAPGSMITSTWIGASNDEIHTISGTSMAAPHVAGVAAAYLSSHPTATPEEVKAALLAMATPSLIDMDCARSDESCIATPDLMLHYNNCQ